MNLLVMFLIFRNQDKSRINKVQGVVFHQGAARKATIFVVRITWGQGDWKVFEMEQIRADNMAPMHRTPSIRIRMVLEKDVIFPLEERESIGVVDPSFFPSDMEYRFEIVHVRKSPPKWPRKRFPRHFHNRFGSRLRRAIPNRLRRYRQGES